MLHNILSCVGFVIFLTGCSHALFETTSGVGTGVMCGGHMCVEEASCSINDTCVCDTPPFDSGNGYLKCFSSDQVGTFLINDPILSTYDREHANLALPCRFEMTRVMTHFLSDENVHSGICTLYVRAFNAKHRGKFFVHGFDTAVRVLFNNASLFTMSVRKTGTADNGTYTYQINATEGVFDVEGPFGNDDIVFYDSVTGLKIVECIMDADNNIVMINIPHCGICIYFRAYDLVLKRDQVQIPGLAIAINHANGPLFTSNNKVLSLIPSSESNAITMDDLPLNVSNTVDIIHRALMSNVPQSNPNANPSCVGTKAIFGGMTDDQARTAFYSCLWLLQSPKFIRCYDDSSNGWRIMDLFMNCVQIQIGLKTCSEIIMIINTSGCQPHDPGNTRLQSFLNNEMC